MTAINPIIQNVIGGNGTITTEAITVIVSVQNGSAGFATVYVDISNQKSLK